MNYTSIVDLIQVFANEYCVPGSVVLLIGSLKTDENEKIRSIFKFIDSDLIIVDSIRGPDVDILLNSSGDLPFENHSFDLIIKINSLNYLNLSVFLKSNGKLLINEEVIGCCELCYIPFRVGDTNIPFRANSTNIDNQVFSVI
jgi:hypothetical protein